MKLNSIEGAPGILSASFDGWDLSTLQAAYREDIDSQLEDENTQSLEEFSDFALRINSLNKDRILEVDVAAISGIIKILDTFSSESLAEARKARRSSSPVYRNGYPAERLALGNVAIQLSSQFGDALSGILENFGNSINSESIEPQNAQNAQTILFDAGLTPETAMTNDNPPL